MRENSGRYRQKTFCTIPFSDIPFHGVDLYSIPTKI